MSLDSPFTHILRKNYIAQPDEEAGIRNIIEEQRAIILELSLELEDVDKAIAALTAKREDVLSKRKAHQTFAADHQSLVSGILHLPVDILSEIFIDLIPPASELSIQLKQYARIHPIVQMSHVCRQWRNIALSNPMLWTTLVISGLPHPKTTKKAGLQAFERRMARMTDMFSEFIRRASTAPMTLCLDEEECLTSTSDMPAYAKSMLPLARVLQEARWDTIRLFLVLNHPDSPLLHLLEILSNSCDTLRDATIMLTFEGISTAQAVVGRLDLERMEQLSGLHINLPEVSPLELRVRWNALTELQFFTPLSVHDMFSILNKCPNLVVFATWLTDPDPPSPQPLRLPHPITLPHLQTFGITGETKDLANNLEFPALRTLQVMDTPAWQGPDQPPHSVLVQWVRDYGAQLTHINFNYGRLSLPTLLRCLESLPVITSLGIGPYPPREGVHRIDERLSSLHRSILHALTPTLDASGTTNCLCPKLEEIIIHAPDVETKIEHWVEFISSRRGDMRGSQAFLKSVEICFHDQDHRERATVASMHVEVLRELTRMGVSADGIEFRVELGIDELYV